MTCNHQDLIDFVRSTCVHVRLSEAELASAKAWCLDTVGAQRPHHPLGEAQTGYMDYFDGEWAYTTIVHPERLHDDDIYNFWFWTLRDATAFALRFGHI